MKINFKCPTCKCHSFEEVMSDVTVSSDVGTDAIYLGDGDIELEYCEQINDGGEVERYQCASCGKLLATDSQALFQYLKDHNMLEFDEDEQEDLDAEENES